MFIGKSAVPCHHPLSPLVPYELLYPTPPQFWVCMFGVYSGWFVKLDHSALPWVVHESHILFFPYCLLFHFPSPLSALLTIDWHNNPEK